jgi:Thiazole biosynthesis protein ThiG
MRERPMDDQLVLYGRKFSSRLLLGTAGHESPSLLDDAIRAADPAMLTVSLRRQVTGSANSGQSFWNLLRETQRTILPNTAGCLSPHEAIKTACMARELFQTNLIKLEVSGDEVSLQPDPFGLIEAANQLVSLGFQVSMANCYFAKPHGMQHCYIPFLSTFPHRLNSKGLSQKRRSFLMKQKSDWKRITLLRKTSCKKEIKNIGR